jgi:hypothetical protein
MRRPRTTASHRLRLRQEGELRLHQEARLVHCRARSQDAHGVAVTVHRSTARLDEARLENDVLDVLALLPDNEADLVGRHRDIVNAQLKHLARLRHRLCTVAHDAHGGGIAVHHHAVDSREL